MIAGLGSGLDGAMYFELRAGRGILDPEGDVGFEQSLAAHLKACVRADAPADRDAVALSVLAGRLTAAQLANDLLPRDSGYHRHVDHLCTAAATWAQPEDAAAARLRLRERMAEMCGPSDGQEAREDADFIAQIDLLQLSLLLPSKVGIHVMNWSGGTFEAVTTFPFRTGIPHVGRAIDSVSSQSDSQSSAVTIAIESRFYSLLDPMGEALAAVTLTVVGDHVDHVPDLLVLLSKLAARAGRSRSPLRPAVADGTVGRMAPDQQAAVDAVHGFLVHLPLRDREPAFQLIMLSQASASVRTFLFRRSPLLLSRHREGAARLASLVHCSSSSCAPGSSRWLSVTDGSTMLRATRNDGPACRSVASEASLVRQLLAVRSSVQYSARLQLRAAPGLLCAQLCKALAASHTTATVDGEEPRREEVGADAASFSSSALHPHCQCPSGCHRPAIGFCSELQCYLCRECWFLPIVL